MKSVHPDDAAASRELVVLVSGRSIELNALGQRLASAGARVTPFPDADAPPPVADVVICDLASDGALARVEAYWQQVADARPSLITLGSARQDISEGQSGVLAQARQRYPRPLDIQVISEEILGAARQPRPSTKVPQSAELSYAPPRARSSRAPRLSAPAPLAPDSVPGSQAISAGPPRVDDAAVASQKFGPPALEHSVVSPELETLLAEAERRVQAQISVQTEATASTPPNGASIQIGRAHV